MKNNLEKVVIVHFGRVGSTVLSQLLNQTPELFSAGEVYNNNVSNYILQKGKPWYLIYDDYLEFLDSYYQETIEKKPSLLVKKKYYIFEYKPYMGGCTKPIEQVFKDFKQTGIDKFIFLYRKNYLKRLVSLIISFETGIWHVKETPEKANQVCIDIGKIKDGDIGIVNKDLIETIDYYYSYVTRIKELIKNYNGINLCFEDDIADNPYKAYQKVCEFLNVQPQPSEKLRIKIKRQNHFPLQEIITNFEEVKTYLKTTKFQLLLEE